MMGMGLWEGLENAPTFERGTFFAAGGHFVLSLGRCLVKQTQSSGTCLIVEFQVVESDRPENPAGSQGTWIQKLENRNVALPAIKGFLYAAFGLRGSDAQDAARCAQVDQASRGIMALATGETNALAGILFRLETEHTTTEKGKDFTRHNFQGFPYETRGVQRPNLDGLLAAAVQALAAPPTPPAWGARPMPAGPAFAPVGPPPVLGGWGAPGAAPPPAGPPPGAPRSPDGTQWWNGSAWCPVPATPPPPPPPPPPAPAGPPPGAPRSPDGRLWWNGTAWLPV